jgi:hypothetical protein
MAVPAHRPGQTRFGPAPRDRVQHNVKRAKMHLQYQTLLKRGHRTYHVIPSPPAYDQETRYVVVMLRKTRKNDNLMDFLVKKGEASINKQCTVRGVREHYFDPHSAQPDVAARGGFWKARGVIMDCGDSVSARLVRNVLCNELLTVLYAGRVKPPTDFVRLVQREFGESFIAVKSHNLRIPKLSKDAARQMKGPKWTYVDQDASIETGSTMVI